jgi:lipopolysaccharide biosynthesis glycosyltransferase
MKETKNDNSNEIAGIPIFLASDGNYAPYVATTIVSICYNTKSFINFYVLDGGINDFNKKQIEALKEKFKNFSIEFIKINIDEIFSDKNTSLVKSYLSKFAYARLLIPNLKPNIDRCLYLDVDIVVLGDIKELYEQELYDSQNPEKKYIIGAVHEVGDDSIKKIQEKKNQVLNMSHKYFNDGVLLIDCKEWRKNDVLDKILEINNEYHKILIDEDQGLLNLYFRDNYKTLDSKFNYYYGTSCNNKRSNIVVRHFIFKRKPWEYGTIIQDNKEIPLENFTDFWNFAKMTPFYEGLRINFDLKNSNRNKKYRIKLFNFFPLLGIEKTSSMIKVKLFGLIPVLKVKIR